jgi:hypothetical protein
MPRFEDRANWVVNQEEQQATFLNRSGLRDEPQNNRSPWSSACQQPGLTPEPPLLIHGYPMHVGRIRGYY